MSSVAPDKPTMYCRRCGYVLDGLPENRCPECGEQFDPRNSCSFRSSPQTPLARLLGSKVTRQMAGILSGLLAGGVSTLLPLVVTVFIAVPLCNREPLCFTLQHGTVVMGLFLGPLVGFHCYCIVLKENARRRRRARNVFGLWPGMKWQIVALLSGAISLVLLVSLYYALYLWLAAAFGGREG